MVKFFKKINEFYKREEKKFFSLFFVILKIVFSLFLTIVLPIIVFIIFIFLKPREIEKLNDFILTELHKIDAIEQVSFKNGKIFIDEYFDFVYTADDLNLKTKDNYSLNLPKISLKISLINFFINKKIINQIELNNLYFKYDNIDNFKEIVDNNTTLLGVKKVINYIYKKNIPIKSFSLNDSIIDVSNKKFYINKVDLNLNKYYIVKKELDINAEIGILKKENKVILKNNCTIGFDENINCQFNILDLSSNDLKELSEEYNLFTDYVSNVDTQFSLNGSIYFKNYIEPEKLNFNFFSKNGNFYLKNFFSDKINYKNLFIFGELSRNLKQIDNLNVNSLIVFDDENKEVKLDLDVREFLNDNNQQELDLNITSKDVPINKINALWPVFIENDDEIKKWVFSSVKNGESKSAFVKMQFLKNNNEYDLYKINSEVDVDGASVNYADFLPVINNVKGKLYFTENDMKIKIDKATFEKTNISNADIYLNFDNPKNHLIINGNAQGKFYEMLYFIDNNSKEKIKNIVDKIVDGNEESKVKVVVPIIDNLDLKDVFIEVNSDVKNVNTYFFKNDSSFSLYVKKDFDSNEFNIKGDFLNSKIYLPFVSFLKNKNVKQSISLGLEILDNDLIKIKNIKTNNGDFVKIDGDGEIDTKLNMLTKLHLDNVKFNDSSLSVNYEYLNSIPNLYLYADYIKLDDLLYKTVNEFKSTSFFKGIIDNTQDNGFVNIEININDVDYKDLRLNNNSLKILHDKNNNYLETISFYNKNDYSKINADIIDGNYWKLKYKVTNLGYILEKTGITKNLLNGNFEIEGDFKNFVFNGKIYSNNKFSILVPDNDETKELKDMFKNSNTSYSFNGCDGDIKISNDIVKLKQVNLYGGLMGVDISADGKIENKSGKIDINGFISPSGVINKLLIIDKIPLVNDLILGGKNNGFFSMKYSLKRKDYESHLIFELNKLSILQFGILKKI